MTTSGSATASASLPESEEGILVDSPCITANVVITSFFIIWAIILICAYYDELCYMVFHVPPASTTYM